MNLWEEWNRAREARRERPRELRRLAHEHPDAPAETFFSADELECLELVVKRCGRRFRPPKTIMDAVVIAGAMMGRATRRGELVYLPSIGTLEKAFERLAAMAEAIRDARELDGEPTLEEACRDRDGEA